MRGDVGWVLAREPLVAVACVIAADLSAAAMMTPKAYRDPDSETLAMYVLASVGGALAAGPSARSTSRCCSTPSTTASPTAR